MSRLTVTSRTSVTLTVDSSKSLVAGQDYYGELLLLGSPSAPTAGTALCARQRYSFG